MYASDEPAVSEAVEAADTDALAADTQLQGTLARSVTLPAAVAYMIFILAVFPLHSDLCRHQERDRQVALGRGGLRLHHGGRLARRLHRLPHHNAIDLIMRQKYTTQMSVSDLDRHRLQPASGDLQNGAFPEIRRTCRCPRPAGTAASIRTHSS